jgi:4-hydroxythreonine-4-phosphate dehydrogenase
MPTSPSAKPDLLITTGDPFGIGPEITLKALAWLQQHQPALAQRCAVITADGVLTPVAQASALPMPAHVISLAHQQDLQSRLRTSCAAGGELAYQQIVKASGLCLAGKANAVITAPISKEALQLAGHHYPGHTELFAHLCGDVPVRMMLMNNELRTVLVTIHLPLAQAITQITSAAVLQTLQITHAAGLGPRIAVAGLNPHAGENGLLGREEIDVLMPAIVAARAQGIQASDPIAPDTVFMRARGFKEFDVVIALYHDQGLIPVKYMGLDHGVNVTLGLPFVRTSPDHGTAFDIAGKGLADPASLLSAIQQAAHLVDQRLANKLAS